MSLERKLPRVINLNVGGLYFCLSTEQIEAFPASYFAHLIKDEWNADQSATVHIDRDGHAFRYVHYYLCTDHKDIDVKKVENIGTLLAVKREADFYNLPLLMDICNNRVYSSFKTLCAKELQHTALFHHYVCVSENEAAIEDPLIQALASFHPPSVATVRLDKIESNRDVLFLPSDAHESPEYHNCVSYRVCRPARIRNTDTDTDTNTGRDHRDILCEWPLPIHNTTNVRILPGVAIEFTFQAGGYCTKRSGGSSVGRIVCIVKAPVAGCNIHTTNNGTTTSISQPGECMALARGCTYTVDTVVSGELVLFEHEILILKNTVPQKKDAEGVHVEWKVEQNVNYTDNTISVSCMNGVISSVNSALVEYSSVVLCLLKYYQVAHSSDSNRHFETDPDTLTGIDAELYTQLTTHYKVDVVTVYVGRVDHHQRVLNACVLDFVTDSTIESTGTEQSTHCTTDQQCKIVAPRYGYGHMFSFTDSIENGTVGDTGNSDIKVWGTVVTGLMVTKKA